MTSIQASDASTLPKDPYLLRYMTHMNGTVPLPLDCLHHPGHCYKRCCDCEKEFKSEEGEEKEIEGTLTFACHACSRRRRERREKRERELIIRPPILSRLEAKPLNASVPQTPKVQSPEVNVVAKIIHPIISEAKPDVPLLLASAVVLPETKPKSPLRPLTEKERQAMSVVQPLKRYTDQELLQLAKPKTETDKLFMREYDKRLSSLSTEKKKTDYLSSSEVANLYRESAKPTTFDASPVKGTEKLPALKRLPSVENPPTLQTRNMNFASPSLNLLQTQHKYKTSIESPAIRALMTGAKPKLTLNQGECVTPGEVESCKDVLRHLKCHRYFYDGLKEAGVIQDVEDFHKNNPGVCLLFVVPLEKSFDALMSNASPDAFAKTMRYHVAILSSEPNTTKLETMEPQTFITIERDEEGFFIDGFQAKEDYKFPRHIVHINGILTPLGFSESVEEETGMGPPTDLPPPIPIEPTPTTPTTETSVEGTQALLHTFSSMNNVNKISCFRNAFLVPIVEAMNETHYSPVVDLASYVQRPTSNLPVEITLRTYDTHAIYSDYKEQRIQDLYRVPQSKTFSMSFPGEKTTTLKLADNLTLMEYRWNSPESVTREELENGLLEVAFSSPSSAETTTVLLTKIHPSVTCNNTYMSENEQVLFRFANNKLHTIAINHAPQRTLLNACIIKPSETHCFEMALNANSRFHFVENLEKCDFDQMLVEAGFIKRAFQKTVAAGKKRFRKWHALEFQPMSSDLENRSWMKDRVRAMEPKTIMIHFLNFKMVSAGVMDVQAKVASNWSENQTVELFTSADADLASRIKATAYMELPVYASRKRLFDLRRVNYNGNYVTRMGKEAFILQLSDSGVTLLRTPIFNT